MGRHLGLTPKGCWLGMHLIRWCTGFPTDYSSSCADLYHEPADLHAACVTHELLVLCQMSSLRQCTQWQQGMSHKLTVPSW